MYFSYFVIISTWKRAGPLIWINMNPRHPMMLLAKFVWNWTSGSGEEDENVKSLRQRQQRRRQRQKLTWALGSGELKSRPFRVTHFFSDGKLTSCIYIKINYNAAGISSSVYINIHRWKSYIIIFGKCQSSSFASNTNLALPAFYWHQSNTISI